MIAEGCAVRVYVVVTEEYYGGGKDMAIFSDLQKAESYKESLERKHDDKVDVQILERILV